MFADRGPDLGRDAPAVFDGPLLKGLSEFREHLGGELTITLLEDIGRGIEVHEMDEERVRAAIGWLKERRTAA